MSVGHPRGTHSRYVIGCCVIPLEICGVKNNSRRITYGIGCIQLFQERLSEKVHATIPKRIVGNFEFTFFQKKCQRMAREAMDVCLRVLKESSKSRFDSCSVRKSALIISHITFRDCRVDVFSDNLSRNSCICISILSLSAPRIF